MGEDPPDDPGGTRFPVPHVGLNVTLTDDSASMDTDGSQIRSDRKRLKSFKRICKTCNRKRRKGNKKDKDGDLSINNCNCDDSDEKSKPLVTNVIKESVSSVSNTANTNVPSSSSTANMSQPQNVRKYEAIDHGPFTVHIIKVLSSPDERVGFHPIQFGNFLKKNNFKNIVNGSLKKIGRNKLSMSFNNFLDANNFVENSCLASNNMKAFIPSFNITRMGVVRGVPADWLDEQILENVSVPIGCGNIIKVRRMKYKSIVNGSPVFNSSETVVLTFDGQVLPKRVFMCYTALSVQLYTYPTIQCYNCCRFGHTKSLCRSKPRCFKCGQGHTGDSCNFEEDSASCCLCSGFHFATNKACPEYSRQKNIKVTMAQNSISYSEASKLHPSVSRSYADVVISSQHHSNTENSSKNIISVSSPSKSHRKTVFLKPRPPPTHSGGYDRQAHTALTKEYDMAPSSQNGSVLSSVSEGRSLQPSITEIIMALIEFLTKSNLIVNNLSPSNVAQQVAHSLSGSIDNGCKDHSVELQKH